MSTRALETPAQAATRLLKELNIKSPPVPIERIARHLGAQVRFSPLDDEISGMAFIKEGLPIIGVNSLHHPNRQRFTIAHECGHLLLHKSLITAHVHVDKQFEGVVTPRRLNRDERSATGTIEAEVQANQFAAALLMPADFLERAMADSTADIEDARRIEKLAQKFKVSKEAMANRLSALFSAFR